MQYELIKIYDFPNEKSKTFFEFFPSRIKHSSLSLTPHLIQPLSIALSLPLPMKNMNHRRFSDTPGILRIDILQTLFKLYVLLLELLN